MPEETTPVVDAQSWRDLSGSRFPLKERGRFAEAHPESAEAWEFFAQGDIDAGQYEDTILHADKATQLDPLRARSWFWKSMARAMLGDIDGAASLLDEVPAAIAEAPDILAARAGILTVKGQFEEAETLLIRARAEAPERVAHWTALAYTQLAMGSPSANETLEEAAERFPEHSDVWCVKGRFAQKARDFVLAEEHGRFAVAAGPESSSAWSLLAQSQRALGKFDEAKISAQNALDINPNRTEAWSVLKAIAIERGDLMEARRCEERVKQCDKLLRFRPLVDRAIESMKRRRWRDASQSARQVLAEPEARLFFGVAYSVLLQVAKNQKNWAEVRAILAEMEGEGQKSAEWFEFCAELEIEEGHPEKALEIANEALLKHHPKGCFHAIRLIAAWKVQHQELDGFVSEAVSSGWQTPADGALIAVALDQIERKDEHVALVSKLKARFPEDQTVELLDAGRIASANPMEALARVKRLTRPEFAPVARLGKGLSCLGGTALLLGLLLLLPIVLVRAVWRAVTGQPPRRP
ncbi:MAG: tetratricopeptide repeat protein [Armatimonadetes bacterium]|nr:tetratricopeptide repeat protein [Armatimonadota bacterium]